MLRLGCKRESKWPPQWEASDAFSSSFVAPLRFFWATHLIEITRIWRCDTPAVIHFKDAAALEVLTLWFTSLQCNSLTSSIAKKTDNCDPSLPPRFTNKVTEKSCEVAASKIRNIMTGPTLIHSALNIFQLTRGLITGNFARSCKLINCRCHKETRAY